MLSDCAAPIAAIAEQTPENEYWKWCGMWTNSLRSAVFGAVLVEYLDSGSLLSQTGVSDIFGSGYVSSHCVDAAY